MSSGQNENMPKRPVRINARSTNGRSGQSTRKATPATLKSARDASPNKMVATRAKKPRDGKEVPEKPCEVAIQTRQVSPRERVVPHEVGKWQLEYGRGHGFIIPYYVI